ncbi:endoplasmic reticulum retention protein, partial [Chytriomyces hyalinus]
MTMNIFRFLGDMAHLVSILILHKAYLKVEGIAVNNTASHVLYLLVFVTRYLDLFYKFYSIYNMVMKVHLSILSGIQQMDLLCHAALFQSNLGPETGHPQ